MSLRHPTCELTHIELPATTASRSKTVVFKDSSI